MGIISALLTAASIASAAASAAQQRKARQEAEKRAKELAGKPLPSPKPILEKEEGVKKFLKKRKGQADTILTGDLIPSNIGKKSLLG